MGQLSYGFEAAAQKYFAGKPRPSEDSEASFGIKSERNSRIGVGLLVIKSPILPKSFKSL
jgi:hypothetical protein